MTNSIRPSIENLSLSSLFEKNLCIPDYQRYYTWKETHVLDLMKDVFDRETPYLMGTVILHQKEDCEQETMDIVDGQQRLVTLTMLLRELDENFSSSLLESTFSASSAAVIQRNRNLIKDFLKGKSEDKKEKFKKRLIASEEDHQNGELLFFSVLTLKGENSALVLDQAFTFFDSVNSKGMPLTDFNLLKAHHLMFIPPKQETLAVRHNNDWEGKNETHSEIFSTMLRRLRMWARGEDRDSRRERPDYNEFVSVVEPEHEKNREYKLNRYMQPMAFRSWRRVGDRIVLSMDYPALEGEDLVPTEITQTIEGGDPFFIYAKRYHKLYDDLFHGTNCSSTEIAYIRRLAENIANDYLRDAFRAVMILYFDKFGEDRLIETATCVERIVSQWRWEAKSVRIEGTLSHVLNNSLIPILLNSVSSLHSYSQLLGICQKLGPVPDDVQPKSGTPRGVRQYYYNSLKQFYQNEKENILDGRIKEIIQAHYKIEE